MKPFGKRIAMAVVCAATLTSPFFLSGCSMSELWQGTEQSRKEIAQRSEQDQVQLFNQYVKAVAAEQDHFERFHNNARFKTLVGL